MNRLTPLQAIKLWCTDCCGDDHPRKCVSLNCPLYPFRLGKNTFIRENRKLNKETREKMRKVAIKNFKLKQNTSRNVSLLENRKIIELSFQENK